MSFTFTGEDYLELTGNLNDLRVNTQQLCTMAGWFKRTGAFVADAEEVAIFSLGRTDHANRRVVLAGIENSSNNPEGAFDSVGGRYRNLAGTNFYADATGALTTGEWHHILWYIDQVGGNTETHVIYDGVEHKSQTGSATAADVPNIARIGAGRGSTVDRFWSGLSADCACWSGVPTDADAMASALYTGFEAGRAANHPDVTQYITGAAGTPNVAPMFYLSMTGEPADWDEFPNEGIYSGGTNWATGGGGETSFNTDHPNLLASGQYQLGRADLIAQEFAVTLRLPRANLIAQNFESNTVLATAVYPVFTHAESGVTDYANHAEDAAHGVEVSMSHASQPAKTFRMYHDLRETGGGATNFAFSVSFLSSDTGRWFWTTNDLTGDATGLDGLTGQINVRINSDPVLGRGHVIHTPQTGSDNQRFLQWQSRGDVIFAAQALMGSPAYMNDSIDWKSWFDYTGDVPDETGIQGTLAEYVGPNSNHGFGGLHLTAYHWRFTGDLQHFGTVRQDHISYQHMEALERICELNYESGGTTTIRYMGDETDGNENNLTEGYNGVHARRLQQYYAKRIMTIPGTYMEYAYDCWEFNGSAAGGPYSLVAEVFDPWFTNIVENCPNDCTGRLSVRGYRGDLVAPMSTLPMSTNYEHRLMLWRSTSGSAGAIPVDTGFAELFEVIQTGNSEHKPRVTYDMFRSRDGFPATTHAQELQTEMLPKAALGGYIWGGFANMDSGTQYGREANEGLGPSNPYNEPYQTWFRRTQKFLIWNPEAIPVAGTRLNGDMRPVPAAWLPEYVDGGTIEDGPVAMYNLTDDQEYLIYTDTGAGSVQIDLSAGAGGMSRPTVAIGTIINADGVEYDEVNIGVVEPDPVDPTTIIFPETGRWLVHLHADNPSIALYRRRHVEL